MNKLFFFEAVESGRVMVTEKPEAVTAMDFETKHIATVTTDYTVSDARTFLKQGGTVEEFSRLVKPKPAPVAVKPKQVEMKPVYIFAGEGDTSYKVTLKRNYSASEPLGEVLVEDTRKAVYHLRKLLRSGFTLDESMSFVNNANCRLI